MVSSCACPTVACRACASPRRGGARRRLHDPHPRAPQRAPQRELYAELAQIEGDPVHEGSRSVWAKIKDTFHGIMSMDVTQNPGPMRRPANSDRTLDAVAAAGRLARKHDAYLRALAEVQNIQRRSIENEARARHSGIVQVATHWCPGAREPWTSRWRRTSPPWNRPSSRQPSRCCAPSS
jgi:hypothetical protein